MVAVTSFRERQTEGWGGGRSDHQCEHQKLMFGLRKFHLSIPVRPIPDSLGGMQTPPTSRRPAPAALPSPREWLVQSGTLLSCLISFTARPGVPTCGATESQGPCSCCHIWASSRTPSIICRLNDLCRTLGSTSLSLIFRVKMGTLRVLISEKCHEDLVGGFAA